LAPIINEKAKKKSKFENNIARERCDREKKYHLKRSAPSSSRYLRNSSEKFPKFFDDELLALIVK
jgi:hypothetical protein